MPKTGPAESAETRHGKPLKEEPEETPVTSRDLDKAAKRAKETASAEIGAAEKLAKKIPPPEKPDPISAGMDRKIDKLLKQKASPEEFMSAVTNYIVVRLLEDVINTPPDKRKNYNRQVTVGGQKMGVYIKFAKDGKVEYGFSSPG